MKDMEKINNKKKNMEYFGGLRLLGYVDSKPLIVQYRLGKDNFEIKFNQEIMDSEFAGRFNEKFMKSNLELFENIRISAPLGYIPKRIKGGRTLPSTVSWIAALVELGNMKSELTHKNGKITKKYFELVAHAIFVGDILYVEDNQDATSYEDATKVFKLKKNEIRNDFNLQSMIETTLFPQFLKQLSNKENILEVKDIKITKKDLAA